MLAGSHLIPDPSPAYRPIVSARAEMLRRYTGGTRRTRGTAGDGSDGAGARPAHGEGARPDGG